MSKALNLLKSNRTVKERAESYLGSIQRNIQRDVIDALIAKKEKLEDEKFELSDFSLETNHNNGKVSMTKEVCEERFKKLINIEYELELITRELDIKQKAFNTYFGVEEASKDESTGK